MASVLKPLPGLALALLVGAVAFGVGHLIPVLGGPIVAIVIGLVIGQFLGQPRTLQPGVSFAARQVLQASIVLLGATMSLGQVAGIGGRALPVMVGTVVIALLMGRVLSAWLGVESQTGSLVTYGTAICGASAIATMSAVMGATPVAVAVSVSVIVVFNVLAALLFPPLGHLLGLSQESFGLWAGTAVNDTSSVLAAATVYGATAASVAVVVKLTRTLALIPIAIGVTWRQRRTDSSATSVAITTLVPPFLLLFGVAAALNTAGLIPRQSLPSIGHVAYFGTTVAMAAVGMRSSLSEVRRAGWRPLALGGLLWIVLATSSLLLQRVTGTL